MNVKPNVKVCLNGSLFGGYIAINAVTQMIPECLIVYYFDRGIQHSDNQLPTAAAHGILPNPGLCSVHSHRGPLLGLLLDQQGGHS